MPFDDIEVSARILLLVIGVFLSVTVFASIYNGYTSGEGIPGPVFCYFYYDPHDYLYFPS